MTQAQFDALVSFTYNTGATRASGVLSAADRGELEHVATLMAQYVYAHPRDDAGRRREPALLRGLVSRRQAEAAPFASGAAR